MRPKNKPQIRVGSRRAEDSFFFLFFLLYFSVIGRYGNAESKAFGCIGEYSFLANTSAGALVAAERSSQCALLMECPRLLRVELNMLFGGVDAP